MDSFIKFYLISLESKSLKKILKTQIVLVPRVMINVIASKGMQYVTTQYDRKFLSSRQAINIHLTGNTITAQIIKPRQVRQTFSFERQKILCIFLNVFFKVTWTLPSLRLTRQLGATYKSKIIIIILLCNPPNAATSKHNYMPSDVYFLNYY